VLFFDSLVGYTLAKFRFPGKKIVFFLIISTLMIPTEMLVIPGMRWQSAEMGQYLLGSTVPGMISAFGVFIFLMRPIHVDNSDDLIDAA